MKKRFLTFLLSFVIIFTSVNMEAFASETVEQVFMQETEGESWKLDEEDLTNDELFDGYVEALMYGGSAVTWGYRNHLTGINLNAFNQLKTLIAQTAKGELASTAYTLTAADLGLEKTTFTAEDLGIDSIVIDQGSYYELNPEVWTAIDAKVGLNLSEILTSLLGACPYELYWFDKVAGVQISPYSITVTEATVTLTSDFVFYFSVEQDYTAGEYLVDTSHVNEAKQAINNAYDIVGKYSSVSDLEKLHGYRKEICELVSYNYQAAAGGVSYGNPWQLIYVFDKNENTNVVCEGYAKAFQYLCDLTEFDNADINCISVSGDMDGGTGAGPHMWNVVTMDDGKNYMVDVTNCDEGTIGADTLLFLAGYASGTLEGGYLYDCDGSQIAYLYDQATLDTYYDSELTMSSLGYGEHVHQWNAAYTVDKPATCTEAGQQSIHCATCGEKKDITVIPQLAHTYGDWVVVNSATESAAGLKKKVCTCGAEVTEVIPQLQHVHQWNTAYTVDKPATCTEAGQQSIHCTTCGEKKDITVIPQLAHTYGDWVVVNPATESAAGLKKKVCTCGAEITEEIPVLKHEHVWNTDFTVDKVATLTVDGEMSKHCATCDEKTEITKINKVSTLKLSYTSTTYNGKTKKPVVTVTDSSGNTLTEGTDYKLTYQSGRKGVGKYSVKVTLQGKYDGSKLLYFTIKPQKTTISTAAPGGCAFTVNWKAVTEEVSGYELQYATNSSFKNAEKVEMTSPTSVLKRVTDVNAGEKYYVRVRTYKEVNGTKIYSSWSSVVNVVPNLASTSLISLKAGGRSFTATWKNISDDVTGYEVQYSTKNTFADETTVVVSKASTVSKKITKLNAATKYFVRVRVFKNVDGETMYSTWSAVKTVIPNSVSTQITDISAGARSFKVEWKKVSSQVDGYEVQYARKKSFSDAKTITGLGKGDINAKVEKLNAGNKYYVRVRTYKSDGSTKYYSVWSSVKTVRPLPMSTTFTSVTAGGRSIKLKWKNTSSQVTGYQIQYDTSMLFKNPKSVNVKGASTVSKEIKSLTAGKKYYVRIRSYRTVDDVTTYSAWTIGKAVTPNPVATTLKSVTAGSKKMTVKWSKVSSQVTGYEIQYSTSSSFSSPTKVKASGASTVSKSITGLKKGKKYYVRIRTYRTVSGKTYYSTWSAKKAVTVK